MKRIRLKDGLNREAVYKLQPQEKYKKLRNFAGRVDHEFHANRYYWVIGMRGGGDWYRGGYHVSPILRHHPYLFYDRYTGEVYKQSDFQVQLY